MSHRFAGDRWLAGEPMDGVDYSHHAAVEIVGGRFDGERGIVALLITLAPEPAYLVTIMGTAGGTADVRVRQSRLRAVLVS